MCPRRSIIVLAKYWCGKLSHKLKDTSLWTNAYGDLCIHLVHILKRRLIWHDIHVFIQGIVVIMYMLSQMKNTQEINYFWFTIKYNYFVLPASVAVTSRPNSDGFMPKGVKTSQRCEWLIVTSHNVSYKINVKPSKVQIPISFLIIGIVWPNKNDSTRHYNDLSENHIIQKWPNLPPKTRFPMARLISILGF